MSGEVGLESDSESKKREVWNFSKFPVLFIAAVSIYVSYVKSCDLGAPSNKKLRDRVLTVNTKFRFPPVKRPHLILKRAANAVF